MTTSPVAPDGPAASDGPAIVCAAPHPHLRRFVDAYHGYRYAGGPAGVHHGLPSTSLTVVLSFDHPLDVGWLAAPDTRRQAWAVASGLHLGPAVIHHDGRQHGIQLGLTPSGARALLGVPAKELRSGLVALDELLGGAAADLYDDVARAPAWTDRFAALDAALLRRAAASADEPSPDETLRHAWRRLHASGGRLPVDHLAAEVGWSRGHLARRFQRELGLGPKQVARLVRFGAARKLVSTGGTRLVDVAADCGYADQAHLTREWQQLTGLSPSGWLEKEGTFLQDLTEAR